MINKINLIIKNIKNIINIKKLKKKIKIIDKKIINYINFKKNNNKKFIILKKKKSKYKKIIKIYFNINLIYKDIKLLYSFFIKENINTKNEIIVYLKKIKNLKKKLNKLIFKKEDILNAIIQINSGAGGKDSCNWVEILERMYKMWAEKKKFTYNIINYVLSEKIGKKYTIFEIHGKYAFGYLKGENGIHKLIRVSPYSKKYKRHTSFASVYVYPLIKDDTKIYIKKKDIIFKTFRSRGAGGQNVNKVETGVRIIHIPTNLSVECTKTRSQKINKEYAIKILKSKLFSIKIEDEKNKKFSKKKKKIEWGNHTRNYIMHPYKLIKDLKTGYKTKKVDYIINGNIDDIIQKYIKYVLEKN
ncbi:MAG: PCRF domain-containing protein [Candidatus Shikimatogenerans bostrichidophilus]|nr:MAG: PCRF domain-containing protein [Candidatus Shikimatogenerans bostrichidophilus]